MNSAFEQSVQQLLQAIEECYSKQYVLPCLILLYSGIDALASIKTGGTASGPAFIKWVDLYMIEDHPFGCSAKELWGARCGLLHCFTAESNVSRNKKVRKVTYSWGSSTAESLNKLLTAIKKPDYVGIHVRDLIDSFESGLAKFIEEMATNPRLKHDADLAISKWFITIGKDVVDLAVTTATAQP